MNQGKAYPTLTERLQQLYTGYISPTPARRDLYNGKEIQTTAGTDYIDYGFRQYDPITARWMAVDPKAEKLYDKGTYIYCSNSPLLIIDLSGLSEWKWEGGDLVAQDGDNFTTLSEFLNISEDDAIDILTRAEIGKIKEGTRIRHSYLYVEQFSAGVVIDHTFNAVRHYYKGNGTDVGLGDATMEVIINSIEFRIIEEEAKEAKVGTSVETSIDMEYYLRTFHIGDTHLSYKVSKSYNAKQITYTFFNNDGFWDVNFAAEFICQKTGNALANITKNLIPGFLGRPGHDFIKKKVESDGTGPKYELWGTPYHYRPKTRTYFYPYEDH